MKVFVQIAAACLVVQLAFAAKGPVAEPVCDAVCPETFPIEDNWHIPYTGDCTKFCHCANDGNWKKDCPPGLHFNAKLQVCDWPASAGCEGGSGPEVTDAPTEKPTQKPTQKPTPSPPTGCENLACGKHDCFKAPSTADCQEYCDCDHGELIVKECAEGLHFNPATGNCDFPENANCEFPTPPNGCEHVHCEGDDCFKTSNSQDCNLYCDCDHGNVTIGHCAGGLHWNPVTEACDFPENAGCDVNKPTATPTTAPTTSPTALPGGLCDKVCPNVWPVEENNHMAVPDCTKFCHCANDGNWLKDCSPGLHFNPIKQVCDWPADAGCKA